jgi:cytochrome c553
MAERLVVCGSCHNPDGHSVNPDFPKLAGQDRSYMTRQLNDIKTGKRKSVIMSGVISVVDPKEFSALATHFSEQKPMFGVKADEKTVAAGKEIFMEGITNTAVPACSGCHNDDGSGTDKYPRLAGQHAPYVLQQLVNLKSGERDNDDRGVMRAVAKRMTEAQMNLVAQYIASMPGGEEK